MNIYTKEIYLVALNPMFRKYRAAVARPHAKFFGRMYFSMLWAANNDETKYSIKPYILNGKVRL